MPELQTKCTNIPEQPLIPLLGFECQKKVGVACTQETGLTCQRMTCDFVWKSKEEENSA